MSMIERNGHTGDSGFSFFDMSEEDRTNFSAFLDGMQEYCNWRDLSRLHKMLSV